MGILFSILFPVFWFHPHSRFRSPSPFTSFPRHFPSFNPFYRPTTPCPFKDSLGKLHPKLPSKHGYPEIDQMIDSWITLLVMHDRLGSHDVRPDGRRRARH